MQVQKHARIANIRKLSKYFLFLTLIAIITFAMIGIASLGIIMMASPGDLTVAAYLAKAVMGDQSFARLLTTGLSMELKVAAVLSVIVFFGMIELVLIHIRQLLICFREGEIFNKKAVFHARRAFNINLILTFIMLSAELIAIALSFTYFGAKATSSFEHFFWEFFDQIIWLGVCLLLLWSLEIGVDLNEEVELTI